MDQAVLVCKELGDLQEVASLAERAANLFQSHGSGDTAAASLDKAAKILEAQNPEQALRLFQHAAEIAMVFWLLYLVNFPNDFFRYKII